MKNERIALLIGINDYLDPNIQDLKGCVNDVKAIKSKLKRNADKGKSKNFNCKLLTTDRTDVYREVMSARIKKTLAADIDLALIYFSGHGYFDGSDLFLSASDSSIEDKCYGVPFSKIMRMAQESPANHIVIILDCCNAGGAAVSEFRSQFAKSAIHLRQDMTILASSLGHEPSVESRGLGKFTRSLCQALEGDYEDPIGEVTVGSLYRLAHRQITGWDQTPVLMNNQRSPVVLRKLRPLMNLTKLRTKLLDLFPESGAEFQLDPEYDAECLRDLPKKERKKYSLDPDKKKDMKFFRELHSFGMLRPVKEKYMYYAAKESDSVRLTPKGVQYHRMAELELF